MAYENPPFLSLIAKNLEKKKLIVDNANITQVILWATPEREISQEERSLLSVAMQVLCAGVPIIHMRTEVIQAEEYFKRLDEETDCFFSQTGLYGRKKRQALRPRPEAKCSHCAAECHKTPPAKDCIKKKDQKPQLTRFGRKRRSAD